MEKMKWLVVIFLLAGLIRFYYLGTSPPGLYVDEAAIGYNAFSILKTGKDEYGEPFPVFFRSFADYKMPLYIYFSVVPIKLFGLNPFAVRFVSALFGTLVVPAVYFLVKQLFPDKKDGFGLLTSVIFAFIPWTVFMSRAAFEANLALFFLLLGISLQIVALKKQQYFLVLIAALVYGLSAYSYHSQRFIAPVVFFSTLCLYGGQYLRKEKAKFLIPILIFGLALIPQLKLSFSVAGKARVNAFSNQFPVEPIKILARYSTYFSPRSLFFDPDPDPQRSYPYLSVFYSWMVVPYLLGLIDFVLRIKTKEGKLLAILFFVSPIPAAIAWDPFSALRAFPLSFPVVVVIGFGLVRIYHLIKKRMMKIIVCVCLSVISIFSLYRNAFVLLPKTRFNAWSYGYQSLMSELLRIEDEKILIEDGLGVSYIEALFFTAYSPLAYQKRPEARVIPNYYEEAEWKNTHYWDRYEVRSMVWEKDIYEQKLIVASPVSISEVQAKEHCLTRIFAIIGPDSSTIFNVFSTNPEQKKIGICTEMI
jgi:4-amino-4-deoxy-L-arabinose transferase-like glycosyltransferase